MTKDRKQQIGAAMAAAVLINAWGFLYGGIYWLTNNGYQWISLTIAGVDAVALLLGLIVGAVVGAAYLLRLFRHVARI